MPDEEHPLRQAVAAAKAFAEAADEMVEFLRRLDSPLDPAAIAEYANLLAREQSTWDARTQALRAAGLTAPSVDAGEGD
jgi:hypothetical protein